MANEIVNVGLGVVLLVMWGYIIRQILDVSTSGYGGKYTTVLPYLLGAFTLLFVFQAIEVGYDLVNPGAPSEPFFFGLQTLQILAGILLVLSVYQLYQIQYATSGFFTRDRQEGEP